MSNITPPDREPEPFPSYTEDHGSSSSAAGAYTDPRFGLQAETTSSVGALSLSPESPTAQRAFRSRRKEPSCDNCRRRKVKCDAEGLGDCSECKSRSVRYQYTQPAQRKTASSSNAATERRLSETRRMLSQTQDVLHTLQGSLAHLHTLVPKPLHDSTCVSVAGQDLLVLATHLVKARFELHRHTLGPAFPQEDRYDALVALRRAARDFNDYVARMNVEQHLPGSVLGATLKSRYEGVIGPAFSETICIQLMRCSIVSIFVLDHTLTLNLIRLGSLLLLRNKSKVAEDCGRLVRDFVAQLVPFNDRAEAIMNDEMLLIALSSGLAIEDLGVPSEQETIIVPGSDPWIQAEALVQQVEQASRSQQDVSATSRSNPPATVEDPSLNPASSRPARMSIASLLEDEDSASLRR